MFLLIEENLVVIRGIKFIEHGTSGTIVEIRVLQAKSDILMGLIL